MVGDRVQYSEAAAASLEHDIPFAATTHGIITEIDYDVPYAYVEWDDDTGDVEWDFEWSLVRVNDEQNAVRGLLCDGK